MNSTLFAKATAEQLFLVNLEIEKKKHEHARKKPKQQNLKTNSDRCIQVTGTLDVPSTKHSILGGKPFSFRRNPPVVIRNEASRIENTSKADAITPHENKQDTQEQKKMFESRIMSKHNRSNKQSNIPLKPEEFEDFRSAYSE